MKGKLWYYLFFADLLLELIALAAGWNPVTVFTKPLLILFLLAWFITNTPYFLPLRFYIAAALFFSWLGDVFLMMEGPNWFIAGLAAFLLAHIMYIVFFLQVRNKSDGRKTLHFPVVLLVTMYVASLFMFLRPYIGALKIPVAIYAITIGLMMVAVLHAFNKTWQQAGYFCMAGAILFIASDSMLAINKFYHSFTGAGPLIMLTYAVAQFAIIKGSLLYLSSVKTGSIEFQLYK